MEVSYDLGVLILVGTIIFVLSRRTAHRAISSLAPLLSSVPSDAEPAAIRTALLTDEPHATAGGIAPRGIAVFVSGHTHAPSSARLERADGTTVAVVNTGCWLRQLQPVRARFGAPDVFVPVFVQSHVRVHRSHDGLVAELWDHPRAASQRLPWIERAAIVGRMPRPAGVPGTRHLMDRQLVANPSEASGS